MNIQVSKRTIHKPAHNKKHFVKFFHEIYQLGKACAHAICWLHIETMCNLVASLV